VNSKDFTLLYVEDNRDTQEWMQLMLEDNFKEYYQAFDGEEGFEAYKKYQPDIIITDINMPVLDGLAMADKIKSLNKHQPIIVMSAFDDKNTLLKAINIGIDYFAPKPVDMDVLNKKIDNVVEDLSNQKELKRLQEKEIQDLYYLAHYDTLTGIQNRFLFEENLKQSLNRAKRMNYELICFFIDLDDFKKINDTYGHAAGDRVLKGVVENIQKVIRSEDTFARLSGDEFALIMEVTNQKSYDTSGVAKKIMEAIGKNIEFEGHSISMSCSIGISCFPQDATTTEGLVRKADLAMYKAKKVKKPTYEFSDNTT